MLYFAVKDVDVDFPISLSAAAASRLCPAALPGRCCCLLCARKRLWNAYWWNCSCVKNNRFRDLEIVHYRFFFDVLLGRSFLHACVHIWAVLYCAIQQRIEANLFIPLDLVEWELSNYILSCARTRKKHSTTTTTAIYVYPGYSFQFNFILWLNNVPLQFLIEWEFMGHATFIGPDRALCDAADEYADYIDHNHKMIKAHLPKIWNKTPTTTKQNNLKIITVRNHTVFPINYNTILNHVVNGDLF